MRRLLSASLLAFVLSLSVQAQITMPSNDGGQSTHAITSEQAFYDPGGKDGDIPKNRTTAVVFTPQKGQVIEVTLDKAQLGGATVHFYDGQKKLVSIEDEYDPDEVTWQKPGGKALKSISGNLTETLTIRSTAADGALTVVFENSGGAGYGFEGKVRSIERPAVVDPEGTVTIKATPSVVTISSPLKFYDDGGPTGKITEKFDGSITFVPSTSGKRIQITFTKLDLFNTYVPNNDQLKVYNGRMAANDQLIATLLKNPTPVSFISAAEDGSMTVTLKSVVGLTRDGFEALVEEVTPVAMSLKSTTQTAVKLNESAKKNVYFSAGDKRLNLLRFTLTTDGTLTPLELQKVALNLAGSAKDAIATAQLWAVPAGSTTASVDLGSVAISGDNAELTLTKPYTLARGTNTFELSLSPKQEALAGSKLTAQVTKVTLSGNENVVSAANPAPELSLENTFVSTDGKHEVKVFGDWKYVSRAGYSGKYEGGNTDQIVTFLPGREGELVEMDFSSFAVYYSNSSTEPKATFSIYAGKEVKGTPLWKVDATTRYTGPGFIRSNSADGALTIVFNPKDNYSRLEKGWEATVRSNKPSNMALVKADSKAFQASTETVAGGDKDAAILGLNLRTQGELSPLTLDELTVNLREVGEYLSAVKLYSTGRSSDFATTTLVASATTFAEGKAVLKPADPAPKLAEGDNYFFITYDLKDDAPAGKSFDAAIAGVKLSGQSAELAEVDPAGARTSQNIILMADAEKTVRITGTYSFYDDGGEKGDYTYGSGAKQKTQTIHFVPAREGESIRLKFNSMAFSGRYNFRVYDGQKVDEANLTAKAEGSGKYSTPLETITSRAADGSVTITFTSTYKAAGWDIEVSAVKPVVMKVANVKAEALTTGKALLRGANQIPLARVDVTIEGDRGAVELDQLTFQLTDSKKAVRSWKLYSVGTDTHFNDANLYAEQPAANATGLFAGKVRYDKAGEYHFYLTADIASDAAADASFSAQFTSARPLGGEEVKASEVVAANNTIGTGKHGNFTIGKGADATYKTLAAAVTDLKNFGVDGPVTLTIEAGEYDEMQEVPEIAGLSDVNTLTITSPSGKPGEVVFNTTKYKEGGYDAPKTGYFTISGADYVTLRGLTIKGSNTKAAAALLLKNGSDHITIENCAFETPQVTSFQSGNMPLVGTDNGKDDPKTGSYRRNNNYLTVTGSTFSGAYIGVSPGGLDYVSDTQRQRGVRIVGNTFEKQGMSAIYIQHNHEVYIEGNTIKGSGITSADYKGIDAIFLGGAKILGNKIYVEGTETTTGRNGSNVYGLYLRASRFPASVTEEGNLIANNEIRLVGSDKNAIVSGISFTDGNILNVNVAHNSILISGSGMKSQSSAVSATGRSNAATGRGNVIQNNLLQNEAGGFVYNIFQDFFTSQLTFANNAGYSTQDDMYGRLGSDAKMTKSAWDAKSGDKGSISAHAEWLDASASLALKSAGSLHFAPRLADVTTDILGDERPADKVTVGAYEVREFKPVTFADGYPKLGSVTDATAAFTAKTTEFATLHYVVKPQSEAAPSLDDLKAEGVSTLSLAKDTELTHSLTDLKGDTDYTLYMLLQGADKNYATELSTLKFTTKPSAFQPADFESVTAGDAAFDNGSAHFTGFSVVAERGVNASSKQIAKVGTDAKITILNSRTGVALNGFFLKSDAPVELSASDDASAAAPSAEAKRQTIPQTEGTWRYISLREQGLIHSLTLSTTGSAYIDNFAALPEQLHLVAETEQGASGTEKTLTVSATGGVYPYSYVWTDSQGAEVAKAASYTLTPDHTQLYTVTVTDAWGNTSTDEKLFRVSGTAAIATFEDLKLEDESYWAGKSLPNKEEVSRSTFYSGSYAFSNTWMESLLTWGGFAYSNQTATAWTSKLFPDQFRSAVGHGVGNSKTYAIAYAGTGFSAPTLSITNAESAVIPGMYVANTAWVKYTIEHGTNMGDDAKEPFGKGDYYTIKAIGSNGKTMDIKMIDYTSDDPNDWYALNDWEWVDLSQLGEVKNIRFEATGTRRNQYGSTIPFYFALDNVGAKEEAKNADALQPQTISVRQTKTFDLSDLFKSYMNDLPAAGSISYGFLGQVNTGVIAVQLNDNKLEVTGVGSGTETIRLRCTRQGRSIYIHLPVNVSQVTPNEDATAGALSLRLYPTPAVDVLHIEAEGEVSIFNLSGVRVYHNARYNRGESISVSSWASGVYLVRTAQGTARFVKR